MLLYKEAVSFVIGSIVLNGLINTVCTQDHTGSKFTVVLMENGIYDGSASMYLKIINHDKTIISFNVTNLIKIALGSTYFVHSVTAMGSSDFSLTTTQSVMNGTGKSNKAIYVNFENSQLQGNLPSVYLVVKNIGASDSTLILPESVLGTTYYAITYCEIFGYCQIAVAHDSSTTPTSVTIRLPSRSDVNVVFENVAYTAGATLTIQLEYKDTIQIQCQCDLTGTFIESTTGNISVFSGSYGAVVGVGGKTDFLLEQMLPVSRWGKEFIVYSSTLRSTGDFIRVIASQRSTIVRISGYVTTKLSQAGDFIHRRIDSGNAVFIRADKPVMVVQFTLNKETSDGLNGDSSMFIVQATSHYLTSYTFHTLNSASNAYIATFVPTNEGGLYLDGVFYNNTGTCCLATNVVPENSIFATFKSVSSGRHTLRSPSNEPFGAYLLEEESGKIFTQIIGLTTAEVSTYKPMVPGDGIDNNNNQIVDEDLGCTETDIKNAMAEIDSVKDCGKILGTSTNEGMFFALVFPGNGESQSTLSFYVSAMSPTTLQYTELSSGTVENVTMNQNIERIVSNGNNGMELANTGVYDGMVFIYADNNVVVHAKYSSEQSAYSYLALPVNAYGLEYFAVTHFAGSNNTITVVAVYNDTVVSIHLPYLDGERVFYEGQYYSDYEVITVTLAQRSSIHIKENLDLTGSYIRASNPVAVFSGADDYLEQLFPTEYFGTVFLLPKLDTAFTNNVFRIVASEGNTICEINHNAVYTTFHNMTFIGEKVDQIMLDPDYRYAIFCRKSVQVTLFAKTMANGGFMTNVVPSQQLKTSYFFTTNIQQSQQFISIHRSSNNFWLKLSKDGGELTRYTEIRFIDVHANLGLSFMQLETQHDNETYSVYVFSGGVPGSTSSFAFGSLGGSKLTTLTKACTPTSHTLNDNVDNDCDGLTDEDICVRDIYKYAPDSYISDEKYIPDFDVDGSLDEDCHIEVPVPSSSTELTSSIEPTPSSYFSSTYYVESTTLWIQSTSSSDYLYGSTAESTMLYASESSSVKQETPSSKSRQFESTSSIQQKVSLSASTQTEYPSSTHGQQETSSLSPTTSSSSKLCGCPCSKTLGDPKYQNLTQEKIDKIVEEIKKELTVEKGNLSSSIRKKISAKDNRPSSTGIGSVGIVFFVIVFGGLILSDITALYQHLRILKENIRGFR